MHGGGFVSGSVHDTESVIPATELAARAGAVVVSVDYRLAIGGVRYPVPLDDVEAAWHWMTQNVDAGRYLIGGASAGANLAIGCAVRLRDAGARIPDGMLLAYPLAHFPTPAPSPERAAELAQLPAMLRFPAEYQLATVHHYLGRVDDLPADAAPGDHDVAGLPEAWIAPAEFDDLRPSGELLAEQLRAAGVPVHVDLAAGMVHGHLGRSPSLEPVSATLDFFASALR
jgi:acetyl esterase/lipase